MWFTEVTAGRRHATNRGSNTTHLFYGRIQTIGSTVTIGDGHITASGHISASGDISAGGGGTGSFDHIVTLGQTIEFKDGGTKLGTIKADEAGSITFGNDDGTKNAAIKVSDVGVTSPGHNIRLLNGHITASGHISASGNVSGSKGHFDVLTAPTIHTTNIKGNGTIDLEHTNGSFGITITTDADPNIMAIGGGLDFGGDHFSFNNDVTASGHISASGTVIANEITASGGIRSTDEVYFGQDAHIEGTLTVGTDVTVQRQLSVAAFVSSSGIVIAKNLPTDFIPIVPQDFTTDNIANIRDYGGYLVNAGGGVGQKAVGVGKVYATKMIPNGYSAVSASIFGTVLSQTITWSSGSILDTGNAVVGGGYVEAATGTGSAYSRPVVGDGLTYVTVQWAPAATSDIVMGGKIYIKPTSL